MKKLIVAFLSLIKMIAVGNNILTLIPLHAFILSMK